LRKFVIRNFIFLFFFSLSSLVTHIELAAQATEICDNGIDDDGDGAIDFQDSDCDCPLIVSSSLIPNPSFEEQTSCPENEAQLNLAVSWIQASAATTDYMHTCGIVSHPVIPGNVPMPIPDGDGCIGFRNGRTANPNFKEYTGTCLREPLEKDVLYILDMWVGFLAPAFSPDFELTIFGAEGCNTDGILPFGNGNPNIGCPLNVNGYEQLGTTVVAGTNEWVNVSITFRPSKDMDVVVIGPNCDANPFEHYYFFDNLILARAVEFGEQPQISGHPCANDISFTLEPQEDFTYQWYKDGIALVGETSPDYSIPEDQVDIASYQLLVNQGMDVCALSDPYIFEIPEIVTEQSISICDNEPIQLSNQLVMEAGVYTEVFVTSQNCDSTVITNVSLIPTFETFIEETICETDQFVLGSQILNLEGTYSEIFKSVQNCDSVVMLDLTVVPAFITADAQGGKTIRLGEQTPILARFTDEDLLETFYWVSSDSTVDICEDCQFQLVSPTETTTYSLRAVDTQGCTVVDNVTIEVEQFYEIYFPNVFSPNRDGVNDFYFPLGTNNVSQILQLKIYDRWGNQVFTNKNFNVNEEINGWDGRFRNQNANIGVYVYVAEVEFVDGNVQVFKGDIILNR